MKRTWSAQALSTILNHNEFGARYRWSLYHLFLLSPVLLFVPLFVFFWLGPVGVSDAMLVMAAALYIGYCVYWSTSIRPYPMISATFAYRHNGKAIWITADELHFFDMAVEMEKVQALEFRPSRLGNDFCLYLNDGKQLVYPADFLIGPLLSELQDHELR
jgi:hypothetical protein